jgi:hypothetical protein
MTIWSFIHPVTPKLTDPKYQENDCSIQIKLGSKPINLFFVKSVHSVAPQGISPHKTKSPVTNSLTATQPEPITANSKIKQVLNHEGAELPSGGY